jgi:HK97 family phage portal protein
MANFLSKIVPWRKSIEGQYRDGPWFLPFSGGWLPADVGRTWNWWQQGFDVVSGSSRSAMVEACISAYSQTVAMCPGNHWLLNPKGGRDRVTTSALSRILRRPNNYQSISDFLLNLTRSLYLEGNAYALALRNDRFEINELHFMAPRQCAAQLAITGEIFYKLGGNEIIERRLGEASFMVPARDVLHVKLHTARSPLRGESPLCAALLDIAAGGAMSEQQIAFFMNQARPSSVLTTDMVLDKDQVQALRDRWNEQSQGLNAGGTPILTAGLKPQMLSSSAKDSELAEIMKLTEQRIALVFRIPLQMFGIGGTPFASTEALMQAWIASGLGFCLNHIEEALGNLFQLRGQPDEYVEFDTDALLRSEFSKRVEAFVRGVQGGIFEPNYARSQFELPSVEFGDEPRVQQQVVPLSAAEGIPSAPAAPAAPAAPPPPTQAPDKGTSNVVDFASIRRITRESVRESA